MVQTHTHTQTMAHYIAVKEWDKPVYIYRRVSIKYNSKKMQVAQHMCNITPFYLLKLEVYIHHTSVHIIVFKNYHLHKKRSEKTLSLKIRVEKITHSLYFTHFYANPIEYVWYS